MKIEKNVPMPEARGRKPHDHYSEVMSKLEIGDSFVAEGERSQTIQSAIRRSARRAGIKVTTRQLNEGDEQFVADKVKIRVWRVEGEPTVRIASSEQSE